jgi:hypothetical protein
LTKDPKVDDGSRTGFRSFYKDFLLARQKQIGNQKARQSVRESTLKDQKMQYRKIKLIVQVHPLRGVLLYTVNVAETDRGENRSSGGTFSTVGELSGLLERFGLHTEAARVLHAQGPCELVFEITETNEIMNALGLKGELSNPPAF